MTFVIVIHDRATEDIAAHANWIANQGFPGNALRWAEDIEIAIGTLARLANRYPVAAESRRFRREVRYFVFKSHKVFYAVEGKTVNVLHVRHTARLSPRRGETLS